MRVVIWERVVLLDLFFHPLFLGLQNGSAFYCSARSIGASTVGKSIYLRQRGSQEMLQFEKLGIFFKNVIQKYSADFKKIVEFLFVMQNE